MERGRGQDRSSAPGCMLFRPGGLLRIAIRWICALTDCRALRQASRPAKHAMPSPAAPPRERVVSAEAIPSAISHRRASLPHGWPVGRRRPNRRADIRPVLHHPVIEKNRMPPPRRQQPRCHGSLAPCGSGPIRNQPSRRAPPARAARVDRGLTGGLRSRRPDADRTASGRVHQALGSKAAAGEGTAIRFFWRGSIVAAEADACRGTSST